MRCWLGCRGRVDCLRLLLVKSLSIASHFEPSSAVVRPGRVAREIVVVSVGSGRLQVQVGVVFPSLGRSSLFPVPVFVVFGNHPSLLPINQLCLKIHDVIPLAANKSSTLCVALTALSATVLARVLVCRLRFRRKRSCFLRAR